MPTEILNAVSDAERWQDILASLPIQTRDIYFQPDYVAMHAPDSDALMFVFRKGGQYWVYPFLRTAIQCIGNQVIGNKVYDIDAPYGYGGPLASTNKQEFLLEAHREFTDWCDEIGIVAEFTRMHPLLGNHQWASPHTELSYDRETVSIDLSQFDLEKYPADKGARYMIRRADRAGLDVNIYDPNEYFDHFVEWYNKAMDRLKAEKYYYFSKNYFAQLKQIVQDRGLILVAHIAQKWIAAAIFLKGPMWLHYHLAATSAENNIPGAMNKLLSEAAKIGNQFGLSRMHFGGGRTREATDSLLKFKQSMSTDTHQFYIGGRIHNSKRYEELRNIWQSSYPDLIPKYGSRILCYRYAE